MTELTLKTSLSTSAMTRKKQKVSESFFSSSDLSRLTTDKQSRKSQIDLERNKKEKGNFKKNKKRHRERKKRANN